MDNICCQSNVFCIVHSATSTILCTYNKLVYQQCRMAKAGGIFAITKPVIALSNSNSNVYKLSNNIAELINANISQINNTL